jgi:4-hydroxyphenylpyruvate dioxygenase
MYEKAVSRGAKSILAPVEMKDENGSVIMATICLFDDTIHSLVQ